MFKTTEADVITSIVSKGRCYNLFLIFVADVKPHCFHYSMLQQLKMADVMQVADGIVIAGWWLVDVITSRWMVLPWSIILI